MKRGCHCAWFTPAAALLITGSASAALQVTTGTAPGNYVLAGKIATPTGVIDGELVIAGDMITCVATNCATPE